MVSLLGMLARPGDLKVVSALTTGFVRCATQYRASDDQRCPDNLIPVLVKVARKKSPQNGPEVNNLIQKMLGEMYEKHSWLMYRNYGKTPTAIWELCDELHCELSTVEAEITKRLQSWSEKTNHWPTMLPGLICYVDDILGAARDMDALISTRWAYIGVPQKKNILVELLTKLGNGFWHQHLLFQKDHAAKEGTRSAKANEQNQQHVDTVARGLEGINSILIKHRNVGDGYNYASPYDLYYNSYGAEGGGPRAPTGERAPPQWGGHGPNMMMQGGDAPWGVHPMMPWAPYPYPPAAYGCGYWGPPEAYYD